MVPELELTRRRALAGLAVGAGGTGVALAPRTWFPNRLIDHMIGHRRVPETDWYPPVPEAAIDEGIARLEATLERADSLWARIDADRDALPDGARMGRSHLDDARDRYDELEDASVDRETLFSLGWALGSAGFAIGAGRLALGEHDADELFRRGRRIREEIDAVGDAIAYAFDSPVVGLARYYRIEECLHHALLNSQRSGIYLGSPEPPVRYQDHDFPRTWQSHLRAELDLLEARHTRRAFEERRGDNADSFADGLGTLFETFGAELETARIEYDEIEDVVAEFSDDVYADARWRLWHGTHGDARRYHENGPPERLVLWAVRHARSVVKLRAYSDAVDRLPLEPGVDPDPATVYRLERRVAGRLRDAVDEYDSPLFRLLAEDPARRVRAVGIGLPGGSDAESRARARANAAVSLAVADAELEHVPTVSETILETIG